VLYASATGASDVNNLAYAVRLGLWGPGTAFATREQFISEIRDGGIAAMELVARDLKASGLYLARALSFAGVEYDILRHDLTSEQIAVYDTYCEAWTIIHQNLEAALELTGIVDGLENKTLNSGAQCIRLHAQFIVGSFRPDSDIAGAVQVAGLAFAPGLRNLDEMGFAPLEGFEEV
jgi:hypothetical protein